jgi:UDPglucose 6-dehydrogenase
MRVAMIGTGYVGLVSGACFADFGHDVTCVDKDASKIAALRCGEMPIYEPGLGELVARNVREGRLAFEVDLSDSVRQADAVFVAVGTPRAAATAMLTSAMFLPPPASSRPSSTASPSW